MFPYKLLKHIYKLRIYFIILVKKFYKTLLVHSIFIAFKCIINLILHINYRSVTNFV